MSYFNRKHFYSIKLQAIVDHNCKFLDVFVGWPGRSHDARAFNNSAVMLQLQNDNFLPNDCFIVGDSAYPLTRNLMTPFRHTRANPQQRRFNQALSKARIYVECAFGYMLLIILLNN